MLRTSLRVWLLALALWPALGGVVRAQELNCWDAGDAAQQAPAKLPQQPAGTAAPTAQNPPAGNAPAITLPPEPLTVGEKFKRGFRRGFGPSSAATSFVVAGFQQARDVNSGFGQGAEGYFSRVASGYGKHATRNMIGSFALASIFRQDPRYFASGRKSKMSRLGYAVSRVLIARGDNGRNQFNISNVGGALAGGLISRTWHEPPDDKIARGFRSAAGMLGMDAVRNVVREFWPGLLRKLGL